MQRFPRERASRGTAERPQRQSQRKISRHSMDASAHLNAVDASFARWQFLQSSGVVEVDTLRSCLSPRAQLVFDHPHVRRLEHISHLGVLYKVNPDVDYCNRLVHSVSVALLARITGLVLADRRRGDGSDTIDAITEDDIVCLEVAGLLHDIGHGPYSHFYDQFAHTHGLAHVPCHEVRGVVITDRVLADVWAATRASEVEVAMVKHFIHPDARCDYSKKALQALARRNLIGLGDIVANKVHGFDVDRLDYLGRDAWLSGYADKATAVWAVVPSMLRDSSLCGTDGGLTWTFPAWAAEHLEDFHALRQWMFEHVYAAERVLKRQRRGVRRSLMATYETVFPVVRNDKGDVVGFDYDAFVQLTEDDFDLYLKEYNF